MSSLRQALSDAELTMALAPTGQVTVPAGVFELIASDVRATEQRRGSLLRWPRPFAPAYPDQRNRWALALTLVLLVVALITATVVAGHLLSPTFPHANGDIYVQFRGGLLVVTADGTSLTREEFPGVENPSAAWSPKGDLIAFWGAGPDHQTRVVLAAPDGTVVNTIEPGAVGLPSNLIAGSVGWSPDGASLILDGDIRGVTHMFRIDLARPVFVDITPEQIYGRSPTWSSSGDIAFIPFDQTQWGRRPWVMSSTGQGARPLLSELPDEMRIDGITWTPDGQRLVIAASNGNQRIYIVDRDGSHLTRLVSALPYPYLAGSSPDGRHLLLGNFLGALDDEMQVYLADTEDEGLSLLMRNAEPLGYSPDGGAILVATPACAWDMRTLNKCDQSVVQIDPATGAGRPLVSADRMDAIGASNDHEGLGWSLWRAVYHQTKATNRGTTH